MSTVSRVRALGGAAPLEGRKLVRLAFMDEGGTSRREPIAVVAAVLIHGDEQLIPVEEHLESLVEKHIPPEDRDGFVLHTTNIWSGTKYFKNKDKWPISKRLEILDDLAHIPERFKLPIAFGFYDRSKFPYFAAGGKHGDKEIDIGIHATAFALCSMVIEKAMREMWPDEISLLIAEDRDIVRAGIKEFHAICRNPSDLEKHGITGECFPFRKIRDTVHFALKRESRHLQIADLCAFLIRGHLIGNEHIPPYYRMIEPCLLVRPKDDATRSTPWLFRPVDSAA